jgi:hypothetical protein
VFRAPSSLAALLALALVLPTQQRVHAQEACAHPIGNGACIVGGVYPARATTSGLFRTVCVRPADGFFFPISFAAPRSQLATDEATCAARCQGGMLYYYANPGASIENAVDRSGGRYRDSPNAFAYRSAYHADAWCETRLPPAKAPPVETLTAVPSPPPAPGPIRIVGPVYYTFGAYGP